MQQNMLKPLVMDRCSEEPSRTNFVEFTVKLRIANVLVTVKSLSFRSILIGNLTDLFFKTCSFLFSFSYFRLSFLQNFLYRFVSFVLHAV